MEITETLTEQKSEYQNLYKSGQKYIKDGEYKKALKNFQTCKEINKSFCKIN
jgi:outer membrane protein assembly factor BamD (BamD/ComL family)